MTRDDLCNQLGISRANLRLYLSWFARSGELSAENIETVKRVVQMRRSGVPIHSIDGFSAHFYRKGIHVSLLPIPENKSYSKDSQTIRRTDTIIRYRMSHALCASHLIVVALIEVMSLTGASFGTRIWKSLGIAFAWNAICGIFLTICDWLLQAKKSD